MTSTAEQTAREWLDACCDTLARYDHAAHMNLISKQVQVFGIPGYPVIGYDDWHAQCAHEFDQKLVASAQYDGLELLEEAEDRIRFATIETISAVDGTVDSHPIEILLAREDDGQWRVVEERLLTPVEALQRGIAP
jgi:ketosteroid isomerase-like protein